VNRRRSCGEVAPHYTICLSEVAGRAIDKQLRDRSVDVFLATTSSIIFGEPCFILNKIDPGTTPLQLALLHDHIDLFKIFLASCRGNVY
jgi:hypothetical protein